MNAACPPDDQLLTLARDDTGSDTFREHVEHCATCQMRVKFLRGEIAELRSLSGQLFDPFRNTVVTGFSSPNLRTGTAIGRYVVIGDLGSGGQADVYRVIDPDLRRDLVLKLSTRQSVEGCQNQDLLVAEGRLLASLDHPGLVRIFDVGIHETRPYLVLDYVQGRNLEQIFGGKRPSPREAARLIAQVAEVVIYAHQRGIAHGDITPRNILIDDRGQVRLIDFGLSKIEDAWGESPGPRGGTPGFLPPEIIAFADQSAGSGPAGDVFGLGATLYWLLTGWPPFATATSLDALTRARHCDIDFDALHLAHVPRDLIRACRQSLAAVPNDRPTAEVLAATLKRSSRRWSPSRVAVAIIAAVLASFALYWLWFEFQEDELPKPPGIVHSVPKITVDGIRTLSNVVPLHTGDKIAVSCFISQGEKATMVWLNANGEVKVYSPLRDIVGKVDRLVYPGPHEEMTLRYPEGTDMIFFCRSESISDESLRACFPIGKPLPTLTSQNYVELQRGEVTLLGPLTKTEIPREIHQIETIMKDINRMLKKHFQGVTGIAFPHCPAIVQQ